MVSLSGLHRTKQPPLTRGLSAELTGGEKIRQLITFFSPSAPLGHLPYQREAGRSRASATNCNFEQASLMRI